LTDNPEIVQTTGQLTAVIRFAIPREQIRSVMGPGMGELMAVVAAQGITPTGPIFSHHFKVDPARFDFELGVAIATPIVATGRVTAGSLPATTVARTTYRGPYEGLADAWGELNAWIEAEGHMPAPDFWECYVAGPDSGPDPAGWRTELNRPLLRKA